MKTVSAPPPPPRPEIKAGDKRKFDLVEQILLALVGICIVAAANGAALGFFVCGYRTVMELCK